ncbi:methyl-accepting chemotaxis sensory transducer with GAF sensor [Rippkaea orientalis PCC 8801]|uniref:Methyl-accepting chemotaxis sensory transducer with GAF sensor n=1 Tax=Rippkaea orientalis (strain PCC 8801 / RF-1) TaxID=41431 RepID=B7K5D0_RIPO1|nr:GAF domain-containing protein [Rippkaea orientalis]ACK67956.1 methyl-accepting chemotaxis sensory transducer with GAF sensor [Rippkaea orientalis PCC 8801]
MTLDQQTQPTAVNIWDKSQAGEKHPELEEITKAVTAIQSQLAEEGKLEDPLLKQQLETLEKFAKQLPELSLKLFKIERDRIVRMCQNIREAKNIEELFCNTVTTIRQDLPATRVLIYRFDNQTNGKVIAESVVSGWTPAMNEPLPVCVFGAHQAKDYVEDPHGVIISNIEAQQLTPYQRQLLDKFQVKSSIAQPILLEGEIWGLLVVQHCEQAYQWQETDISLIHHITIELTLALQPKELRRQLEQQLEREKLLDKIVQKIQQSQDIDEIFKTTTNEIRYLLKADRAVIYQFNSDWTGQPVAESVGSGWNSLFIEQTNDPILQSNRTNSDRCILRKWAQGDIVGTDTYFQSTAGGKYNRGQKVSVVNDVYAANFPNCYIESLEKYQATAYIIVPIFQNQKLWGLLGCYNNTGLRNWQDLETKLMIEMGNQLAVAIKQAQYVEDLKRQSQEQAEAAEREKTKATIIKKIRQSHEIENIFKTTVQEVRQMLKADRAVIYEFNSDWTGQAVAEAVGSGWISLLVEQTNEEVLQSDRTSNERCILRKWYHGDLVEIDTFFQQTQGGRFRYPNQQKFTAINDIYATDFPSCYIESLEKYQAKAYIIVPIFKDEQLWGLLGCYQNTGTRNWQESEIQLMLDISDQLGIAIKQAHYVEELKRQSEEQAEATKRERTKATIIKKIRHSQDMDTIFKVAVQEIRKVLKADRTLIYQFNTDWTGSVVAESVGSGWVSLLVEQTNDRILSGDRVATERCILRKWSQGDLLEPDTYFESTGGGKYSQGETVTAVNDVYAMDFPECYIESLEKYQAKAYIIVPIFQGRKLWGLMGCYQNSGPRTWQNPEIDLLQQISSPLGMAIQQGEFVAQLQYQAQQAGATNKIINQIRKSLDLSEVFRITTQEIRNLLQADRTVVYRFNADWSGEVIAESVNPQWVSVMELQQMDQQLYRTITTNDERCTLKKLSSTDPTFDIDTYLQETKGGSYTKGKKITIVNDIYKAGFSPCYIEFLEKYQAKAYIIIPIFRNEDFWGLLAVYHNSNPRKWQDWEVELMLKIAPQLSIAVQQAQYIQQLQDQSQELETVANRERGLARLAEKLQRTRSLETILQLATRESRKLLGVERIGITRFNRDGQSQFVAESAVGGSMKSLVGNTFTEDSFLLEMSNDIEPHKKCVVIDDVYQGEFEDSYLEQLEQFEIKAYITAPIFVGQKLWGLIGAYQHSGARVWEKAEVNILKQIGQQIGSVLQEIAYLKQVRSQSENLAKAAERETNFIRLLAKINQKIIEQSQEQLKLDSLFRTSSQELRKILKADRVAVLQFNIDWSGEFIAEDVGSGYLKLVGTEQAYLRDPDIQENRGGRYRKNDNLVVEDIEKADLSAFEREFLEELGAKACLVTPIFKGEQLWGLLATYQNDRTRAWEEGEINLLVQASVQLGVAIQQREYLKKVEDQSQQLAETVKREKGAKEELQKRVIDLLSSVQPAATGNLTVRAPVTNDAVGTIADAYNCTIDALREIVTQVQKAAKQVVETTGDSTTAIEGLATQAQQQFEELNQALAKIQEMVKATESTTENAQQVGMAVEKANQTLQVGDRAMNKTVDSILGIRQTVAETSKRVQRLRESSQKISKVVSLISDFAKQTNLLALNAALEATRAGEYGKGFAVVADEVRNLSHQSAEATTEIEKLVLEIQNETQEVAAAMDTGIDQVAEGTNLVNETRENLNELVTATVHITQLVNGITQATNLQTQQAEAVTEVMTEVAAIANDTSADSLKISASFKELLAMAQELQASAGQFKVN